MLSIIKLVYRNDYSHDEMRGKGSLECSGLIINGGSLTLVIKLILILNTFEMNPMKKSCIEFMQNREENCSAPTITDPLLIAAKNKFKTLKVKHD